MSKINKSFYYLYKLLLIIIIFPIVVILYSPVILYCIFTLREVEETQNKDVPSEKN